jgi:hypothetical protein
VTDDRPIRTGASGVFKALVDKTRDIVQKARALSESDTSLPEDLESVCTKLAQAFVVGRFADAYALSTSGMQKRVPRERFESAWRDATRDRGPFTGYELANAGFIELGYIPGLEEVPQDDFAGFVEIRFSSPEIPLDDPRAFTLGVVLLEQSGQPRVGDLHRRT